MSATATKTPVSIAERAGLALEFEGVTQVFGALVALSDVTFSITAGERHAILGANGAGKTTLYNVVTGDFPLSRGRVRFFGEDITDLPPHERIRRGLRRTYQKSLLFAGLAVEDNLYLAVKGVAGGRMSFRRPKPNDIALETAAELAELVDLQNEMKTPVSDLSHGQQRQLEIALALAGAPRLVLFDEPAAGLSPLERRNLIEILESLPLGLGYVIIEHDLDVALRVAERVTIMHNGKVLKQGLPEEIENDAEVQAIYLGGKHD